MTVRLLFLTLLLACVSLVQAQICTGSLGDPIVNITFGAGANPGPQLNAVTTNYAYQSNDCPNDGFYTVRNSSVACFSTTWHTFSDHTGDAGGYFMLVNGSIQPSAFYVDTVRNLCGNTTYEFAAWVMNVLLPSSCGGNGIKPDITFRMEKTDGTILQSYNTGAIASTGNPQWKQYGFFFTTDANTSTVVLRMINNSTGGCGNDLALDDITFRACGPQITSVFDGTTATTQTSCEGSVNTYTFTGTLSAGYNNPVVQWQQNINGAGWTDIAGANSLQYTRTFDAAATNGNYQFRLTASEAGNQGSVSCRVVSPALKVDRVANPGFPITASSPACLGGALDLSTTATNGTWSGPAGFTGLCCKVTINNLQSFHTAKYYFTATNGTCTRTDSVSVVVSARPMISISPAGGTICEGDSLWVSYSGADNFTWTPAASRVYTSGNTAALFPTDTSSFLLRGINNTGCTDSASVNVNVNKAPVANAGPDRTMLQGNSIQLNGQAGGGRVQYAWWPPYMITGIQSLQPIVSPLTDTSYILQVTSLDGCGTDADTMRVRVFQKLFIPNAFSPNGDGVNDVWVIGGLESYPGARVSIFNRYGNTLLNSTSFTRWNGTYQGKPLPAGTYYYLIDVQNGYSPLTGWVQIIY